ncbi:hypothetical protein [Picoa juniperi megatotivirus 1]|uniref:F-box domain-containing protein n=1 Tax=Picoa juniperi megatotivirus 1 TaxID=2778517 RepID=A0A7L8Y8S5_9VIRU|nr:hypothetical protein [Picoa juniperi megatotivirus 1]
MAKSSSGPNRATLAGVKTRTRNTKAHGRHGCQGSGQHAQKKYQNFVRARRAGAAIARSLEQSISDRKSQKNMVQPAGTLYHTAETIQQQARRASNRQRSINRASRGFKTVTVRNSGHGNTRSTKYSNKQTIYIDGLTFVHNNSCGLKFNEDVSSSPCVAWNTRNAYLAGLEANSPKKTTTNQAVLPTWCSRRLDEQRAKHVAVKAAIKAVRRDEKYEKNLASGKVKSYAQRKTEALALVANRQAVDDGRRAKFVAGREAYLERVARRAARKQAWEDGREAYLERCAARAARAARRAERAAGREAYLRRVAARAIRAQKNKECGVAVVRGGCGGTTFLKLSRRSQTGYLMNRGMTFPQAKGFIAQNLGSLVGLKADKITKVVKAATQNKAKKNKKLAGYTPPIYTPAQAKGFTVKDRFNKYAEFTSGLITLEVYAEWCKSQKEKNKEQHSLNGNIDSAFYGIGSVFAQESAFFGVFGVSNEFDDNHVDEIVRPYATRTEINLLNDQMNSLVVTSPSTAQVVELIRPVAERVTNIQNTVRHSVCMRTAINSFMVENSSSGFRYVGGNTPNSTIVATWEETSSLSALNRRFSESIRSRGRFNISTINGVDHIEFSTTGSISLTQLLLNHGNRQLFAPIDFINKFRAFGKKKKSYDSRPTAKSAGTTKCLDCGTQTAKLRCQQCAIKFANKTFVEEEPVKLTCIVCKTTENLVEPLRLKCKDCTLEDKKLKDMGGQIKPKGTYSKSESSGKSVQQLMSESIDVSKMSIKSMTSEEIREKYKDRNDSCDHEIVKGSNYCNKCGEDFTPSSSFKNENLVDPKPADWDSDDSDDSTGTIVPVVEDSRLYPENQCCYCSNEHTTNSIYCDACLKEMNKARMLIVKSRTAPSSGGSKFEKLPYDILCTIVNSMGKKDQLALSRVNMAMNIVVMERMFQIKRGIVNNNPIDMLRLYEQQRTTRLKQQMLKNLELHKSKYPKKERVKVIDESVPDHPLDGIFMDQIQSDPSTQIVRLGDRCSWSTEPNSTQRDNMVNEDFATFSFCIENNIMFTEPLLDNKEGHRVIHFVTNNTGHCYRCMVIMTRNKRGRSCIVGLEVQQSTDNQFVEYLRWEKPLKGNRGIAQIVKLNRPENFEVTVECNQNEQYNGSVNSLFKLSFRFDLRPLATEIESNAVIGDDSTQVKTSPKEKKSSKDTRKEDPHANDKFAIILKSSMKVHDFAGQDITNALAVFVDHGYTTRPSFDIKVNKFGQGKRKGEWYVHPLALYKDGYVITYLDKSRKIIDDDLIEYDLKSDCWDSVHWVRMTIDHKNDAHKDRPNVIGYKQINKLVGQQFTSMVDEYGYANTKCVPKPMSQELWKLARLSVVRGLLTNYSIKRAYDEAVLTCNMSTALRKVADYMRALAFISNLHAADLGLFGLKMSDIAKYQDSEFIARQFYYNVYDRIKREFTCNNDYEGETCGRSFCDPSTCKAALVKRVNWLKYQKREYVGKGLTLSKCNCGAGTANYNAAKSINDESGGTIGEAFKYLADKKKLQSHAEDCPNRKNPGKGQDFGKFEIDHREIDLEAAFNKIINPDNITVDLSDKTKVDNFIAELMAFGIKINSLNDLPISNTEDVLGETINNQVAFGKNKKADSDPAVVKQQMKKKAALEAQLKKLDSNRIKLERQIKGMISKGFFFTENASAVEQSAVYDLLASSHSYSVWDTDKGGVTVSVTEDGNNEMAALGGIEKQIAEAKAKIATIDDSADVKATRLPATGQCEYKVQTIENDDGACWYHSAVVAQSIADGVTIDQIKAPEKDIFINEGLNFEKIQEIFGFKSSETSIYLKDDWENTKAGWYMSDPSDAKYMFELSKQSDENRSWLHCQPIVDFSIIPDDDVEIENSIATMKASAFTFTVTRQVSDSDEGSAPITEKDKAHIAKHGDILTLGMASSNFEDAVKKLGTPLGTELAKMIPIFELATSTTAKTTKDRLLDWADNNVMIQNDLVYCSDEQIVFDKHNALELDRLTSYSLREYPWLMQRPPATDGQLRYQIEARPLNYRVFNMNRDQFINSIGEIEIDSDIKAHKPQTWDALMTIYETTSMYVNMRQNQLDLAKLVVRTLNTARMNGSFIHRISNLLSEMVMRNDDLDINIGSFVEDLVFTLPDTKTPMQIADSTRPFMDLEQRINDDPNAPFIDFPIRDFYDPERRAVSFALVPAKFGFEYLGGKYTKKENLAESIRDISNSNSAGTFELLNVEVFLRGRNQALTSIRVPSAGAGFTAFNWDVLPLSTSNNVRNRLQWGSGSMSNPGFNFNGWNANDLANFLRSHTAAENLGRIISLRERLAVSGQHFRELVQNRPDRQHDDFYHYDLIENYKDINEVAVIMVSQSLGHLKNLQSLIAQIICQMPSPWYIVEKLVSMGLGDAAQLPTHVSQGHDVQFFDTLEPSAEDIVRVFGDNGIRRNIRVMDNLQTIARDNGKRAIMCIVDDVYNGRIDTSIDWFADLPVRHDPNAPNLPDRTVCQPIANVQTFLLPVVCVSHVRDSDNRSTNKRVTFPSNEGPGGYFWDVPHDLDRWMSTHYNLITARQIQSALPVYMEMGLSLDEYKYAAAVLSEVRTITSSLPVRTDNYTLITTTMVDQHVVVNSPRGRVNVREEVQGFVVAQPDLCLDTLPEDHTEDAVEIGTTNALEGSFNAITTSLGRRAWTVVERRDAKFLGNHFKNGEISTLMEFGLRTQILKLTKADWKGTQVFEPRVYTNQIYRVGRGFARSYDMINLWVDRPMADTLESQHRVPIDQDEGILANFWKNGDINPAGMVTQFYNCFFEKQYFGQTDWALHQTEHVFLSPDQNHYMDMLRVAGAANTYQTIPRRANTLLDNEEQLDRKLPVTENMVSLLRVPGLNVAHIPTFEGNNKRKSTGLLHFIPVAQGRNEERDQDHGLRLVKEDRPTMYQIPLHRTGNEHKIKAGLKLLGTQRKYWFRLDNRDTYLEGSKQFFTSAGYYPVSKEKRTEEHNRVYPGNLNETKVVTKLGFTVAQTARGIKLIVTAQNPANTLPRIDSSEIIVDALSVNEGFFN